MPSSYPTTLDTTTRFPTDVTDDTDSKSGTPRTGLKGFLAQLLDDQNSALVAIETELGTVPKGSFASVSARFDSVAPKLVAQAASTANVTLPPGGTTLTIDGVVLANNDDVLLKDQTTPAQNGDYVVTGVGTSVTLVRSPVADTSAKLDSLVVSVSGGTVNGDTQWRQVSNPPLTVGTTALRWTRVFPSYQPFVRNPWAPGAVPPLLVNMDRETADSSVAQTAITAITSLHAGLILRAGTTYSNINVFCTATGAGAVTTHWFALVRQSDRAVLQATANSTVLPALGVYTRAITPLTVDVDTPCWLAWASQVATTSPAFAGKTALTALVQPFALVAPIFQGNSATAPTATPPTNGTVLAAPTTATGGRIYTWLT